MSFFAFLVAPFLTNDGVCLLFVEIILNAFDLEDNNHSSHERSSPDKSSDVENDANFYTKLKRQDTLLSTELSAEIVAPTEIKVDALDKKDAIYFLLSLACSSNIGSALTYTGNPQNMLVSTDAISVMSPGLFLLYMLVPTVASWLISKY